MSLKAQTQKNEKTVLKQRSSQQTTLNVTPSAHQTHPVTIIQRAQLAPLSLSQRDVLHLQSTSGNRAVGALLRQATQNTSHASSRLIAQKKLTESTFGMSVQCQSNKEEDGVLQGKFTPSETPAQFQGNGGEAENRTGVASPIK